MKQTDEPKKPEVDYAEAIMTLGGQLTSAGGVTW